MPFTFSHPAAILPLIYKRRRIFSSTGLIIGSIAPDFESFIRVSERKIYSHTWSGMFWYDLPLALVICMIFHLIVRDPLIENMPLQLEARFEEYKGFKWLTYFKNNFIVVIISLLIGLASHLLWDAFTHLNLHNPDSIKSRFMFRDVRLYIVLQYACSLLGMVAIVIFIYKMPQTIVKNTSRVKFKFWLFVVLIALLAGVYLLTNQYDDVEAVSAYMKADIISYIYIVISSLLISLVIVSLIYTVFFRKRYYTGGWGG